MYIQKSKNLFDASALSPAPGTVAQPLLQVAGHSEEPLLRLTYELFHGGVSIASGSGFVLGAAYDPVWRRYSTNVFQLFDLRLQPGTNTLVLTAVNPAGQTNIFTYEYILNLALDQTPPVITHLWPPDGAWVSGASFTLRGVLDDPATSVHLLLVADGLTNEFYGVVERTGQFWVDALPLAPGTNTLILIATDAAGNATTNFSTVRQSSLLLAVTTNTTDIANFNQDGPGIVTGLIDSTNHTVWVNGVRAVFTSPTNWIAYNVPTDRSGVGLLQVIAIPNDDNNGNGMGGGAYSVADPGNPAATNGVQFAHEWEKPSFHYTAGWTNNYAFTIPFFDTNNPPVETQQHQWSHGGGGSGALSGPRAPGCAHLWENRPESGALTNAGYWCGGQLIHTSTGVEVQGNVARVLDAELSGAHPPDWDSLGASFVGTARSRTAYRVGGRAIPGERRLFLGSANVTGYTVGTDGDGFYSGLMNPSDPLPVPRDSGFVLDAAPITHDQITLLGETLDENFEMRTLVPVALLDTTLAFAAEAPPARTGGVNGKDTAVRIYRVTTAGETDVTGKTNTVWAGRYVLLKVKATPFPSGPTSNHLWSVSGNPLVQYIRTLTLGSNVPLTVVTNDTVYFAWTPPGHQQVVCTCNYGGFTFTPKTFFNVRRPDPPLEIRVGGPIAVGNYPNVGSAIHFGLPDSSPNMVGNSNGMIVTLRSTDLPSSELPSTNHPLTHFFFLQTGSSFYQINFLDGTNQFAARITSEGLDTEIPYLFSQILEITNQSPFQTNWVAFDSPFGRVAGDMVKVWRGNSLSTFLFFMADSSAIPVAIKKVDWAWSGIATNGAGGSGLLSATYPTNLTAVPVFGNPTWTNNLANRTTNWIQGWYP